MFHDRIEAGILLVKKLRKYKGENCVILGIPRGGIPVAYTVATELDLPLDIILTRKIGHPLNKEFAIGAASLNDYFIEEEDGYVSKDYVKEEVQAVQKRLNEMKVTFKGNKADIKLEDKIVIIVDDGIATGNTLLAAIRLLRKSKPDKIIVAVPVASNSAVGKISKEADEVITVIMPYDFHGVGQYYESFETVNDDEVTKYLSKISNPIKQ
jgi:predicted phosphoribosyltransferase